jgi:hypothetical protein
MKNSTKHLILVQAALVSLLLAGCSSVNTTQKSTVSDVVGEVTRNDNIAEEPSKVLVGYSIADSPVRSNSVWTSHKIVKEPIPQGLQGHVLQANDTPDVKPTRPSQLSKRATTQPKRRYSASPKRQNVMVGDALKEVFGSSRKTSEVSGVNHTIKESIVMDAVVQVIGKDSKDEEQPTD